VDFAWFASLTLRVSVAVFLERSIHMSPREEDPPFLILHVADHRKQGPVPTTRPGAPSGWRFGRGVSCGAEEPHHDQCGPGLRDDRATQEIYVVSPATGLPLLGLARRIRIGGEAGCNANCCRRLAAVEHALTNKGAHRFVPPRRATGCCFSKTEGGSENGTAPIVLIKASPVFGAAVLTGGDNANLFHGLVFVTRLGRDAAEFYVDVDSRAVPVMMPVRARCKTLAQLEPDRRGPSTASTAR